jgi:hypothetical protein
MATRKTLVAIAVATVLHGGRNRVLAQSLYTLPEGVDTNITPVIAQSRSTLMESFSALRGWIL